MASFAPPLFSRANEKREYHEETTTAAAGAHRRRNDPRAPQQPVSTFAAASPLLAWFQLNGVKAPTVRYRGDPRNVTEEWMELNQVPLTTSRAAATTTPRNATEQWFALNRVSIPPSLKNDAAPVTAGGTDGATAAAQDEVQVVMQTAPMGTTRNTAAASFAPGVMAAPERNIFFTGAPTTTTGTPTPTTQSEMTAAWMSTVAGTVGGYWESYGWVAGTAANLAVSGYVTVLFGAPVAAYIAGSLAATLVTSAPTLVTDPKTGLKQVGRAVVCTAVGSLLGGPAAAGVFGQFGGRIVGTVVGNTFTGAIFGNVTTSTNPEQARADRIMYGIMADIDAKKRKAETRAGAAKVSDASYLSYIRRRPKTILAAVAVGSLAMLNPAAAGNVAFGVGRLAGQTVGAYMADVVRKFAANPVLVGSEYATLLSRNQYAQALLKQSVMRKIPMERIDDLVERATKNILNIGGIGQTIDNATKRALKGRVRDSVIQQLLFTELTTRVAKAMTAQAGMDLAQRGAQQVYDNYDTVEDAVRAMHAGQQAVATSIRAGLSDLQDYAGTTAAELNAATLRLVERATQAGVDAINAANMQREASKAPEVQAAAQTAADALSAATEHAASSTSQTEEVRQAELNKQAEAAIDAVRLEQKRQYERIKRSHDKAEAIRERRAKEVDEATKDVQAAVDAKLAADTKRQLRKEWKEGLRAQRAKEQEQFDVAAAAAIAESARMYHDAGIKVLLAKHPDLTKQDLYEGNVPESVRMVLDELKIDGLLYAGVTAQTGWWNPLKWKMYYDNGLAIGKGVARLGHWVTAKDIAEQGAEGATARAMSALDDILSDENLALSSEEIVKRALNQANVRISGEALADATKVDMRDMALGVLGIHPTMDSTELLSEALIGKGAAQALQSLLGNLQEELAL